MTTITISLPDSLKAFIDSQVAGKGYGNVSEYVRSLLREALAKEEDVRLEALLLEGLTWISQTRAVLGGEPGGHRAFRWCVASGWLATCQD